MPDFYDSMYEAGFDDPAEYMDYLESQDSDTSFYYDNVEYDSYPEWNQNLDEAQSQRLELLLGEFRSWQRNDPRGHIFAYYYLKISYPHDDLLLERLEEWKRWLSLTNINKERYLLEVKQSQKNAIDNMLRTYSICDTFYDIYMTTWWGEIRVFDYYPYLKEWINCNPHSFQDILKSLETSIEDLGKEYSKSRFLEAVIWKYNYMKLDDSAYSLFKNLDDDNRRWRECLDAFYAKKECSGTVFNDWKKDHEKEWNEFFSSDEAKQLRDRIQKEEAQKTLEELWDEKFLALSFAEDDPDSPFDSFVDSRDWRYESYNGKEEVPVFNLWIEKNQDKWREWSEVYLWNNNMGGFKNRFYKTHLNYKSNLPGSLYWIYVWTISVFNSWIKSHSKQWEEYLNTIEYRQSREALLNSIALYEYLRKNKERLGEDKIALSLGDYLSSCCNRWPLTEKLYYQSEKERSLKMFDKERDLIKNKGRSEYWGDWVEQEYDNLQDMSFEDILKKWYQKNGDENLIDYYDRCVYMYWLTLLAKDGVIESSYAYENIAGFF